MKSQFIISLFMSAFFYCHASAQESEKKLELPECDIFLFDLDESKSGMEISNGRNITKRKGYDNQPWFTPDSGSVLFTANHKADRTDIFEYFIETGDTKQVTDSLTQEYSPQVSPNNKTVSFVTDGETANQSIWFIDRQENDEPSWLLKNQNEREPVGYYSWNHESGYILFWSRYGFSLRLVHRTKEVSHYVTDNAVPSSPYIIPGTGNFSFMHRQGNSEVWIKELNPETLAIRPLTKVIGTNPNYGWTPSGSIVMCDGTKLYRWSPKSEKGWELIADLSQHSMGSASRVAVSPDGKKIAIVGMPGE